MSPKANELLLNEEKFSLRKLRGLPRQEAKNGEYYTHLTKMQRARFTRIVGQLSRALGLRLDQHPNEMILIKSIAIDEILADIAMTGIIKDTTKADIWSKNLFAVKKDLRESMHLLWTIAKTTDKKKSVSSFANLRDTLRKEEKLPPSEHTGIAPDGHDRRWSTSGTDGITRTCK